MSDIRIQAQISTDDLLQALEKMPPEELASFVERALAVRAQKIAPHIEADEANLLELINQTIPVDLQSRFDLLVAKRVKETLSTEEHQILLVLSNEIEKYEAKRVDALSKLAQIRHKTLKDLMNELGI